MLIHFLASSDRFSATRVNKRAISIDFDLLLVSDDLLGIIYIYIFYQFSVMQYLPRKFLKIQWTGTLSLLSPRGKLDTPVINGVHAPTTNFRYAMIDGYIKYEKYP